MKTNLLLAITTIWITTFGCSGSKQIPLTHDVGPKTEVISQDAYQKFRYVSATKGSDQNGDGTKSKPWQSLTFAISQINDAKDGHRYAVLVSEGIYNEGTITMQPFIDLYGGFSASNWQRDIFRYRTVLTGVGWRRIGIGADNARLDGFVIARGQVRGNGAGLLCQGVSPVITNNLFVANKTLAPRPWKPKFRHEIANDGGAIYCSDGASAIIENNLFANDSTEAGRGAAIALHNNCKGHIANNVFIENVAGTADPLRSSDGGAISIFNWSSPVVEKNIILNNKALANNDAGGVFVALWSSPVIADNIFVGNRCDDDAGALFVGGQEHRYDRPLDPIPPKNRFYVKIHHNLFVGNANPSGNSGVMRFTMESRGEFSNNITAHNNGVYFQRSEAIILNNLILDNFLLVETKQGLNPCVIQRNTIWGNFDVQVAAEISDNEIYPDENNIGPAIIDDSRRITVASFLFSKTQLTTLFLTLDCQFKTNELVNRVVRTNDKWGVIKSNSSRTIEVWGDCAGDVELTILPSYQLGK